MSNTDSDAGTCQSKACNQPAIGVGPNSHLNLCQEHMADDVERVQERSAALTGKLQRLMQPDDQQQRLQAEQEALEAEMLEDGKMFEAVQKKLQLWKITVEAQVRAKRDSIAKVLADSSAAKQFNSELTEAAEADDMLLLMERTAATEPWADDACERSTQFEQTRLELRKRQSRRFNGDCRLRSVGDVAAGVQQLQLVIDRHMADVMKQCWLDEEEADSPRPVCRSVTTIGDLEGEPCHVTGCTNVNGFASDSSGRVVKQSIAEGDCSLALPQPCIFVAFKETGAELHLLVTSLDGAVRLRCQLSSLDWSQWISGLQCHSQRQLLFVAQYNAVSVADLAGTVSQVVTADNLGLTDERMHISAMTSSSEKVFLLNTPAQKVHILPLKDSAVDTAAATAIDVSSFDTSGALSDLALHGSKILLVDSSTGQMLRLCSVSGQLIDTFGHLDNPCQLAVDNRAEGGLVFVNECAAHTVRVLSSSGDTLVQTLGLPGTLGSDDQTFNWPFGLCVLAGADGDDVGQRLLVVADRLNARLRLFELL